MISVLYFILAQEHRKLTFIYLANDVIQNGRKKGTEFLKAFAPIFKKSFEHMARIPGEKVKKSVRRIFSIWEERGIYETKLIKDFEKLYLKAWDDLHGGDDDEYDPVTADFDLDFDSFKASVTSPPQGSSAAAIASAANDSKAKAPDRDKKAQKDALKKSEASKSKESKSSHSHSQKKGSSSTSADPQASSSAFSSRKHESSSNNSHSGERKKRKRSQKEELDSLLRKRSLEATNVVEEWETDGVVQLEVKLSPSIFTEPPTEEELIRIIKARSILL